MKILREGIELCDDCTTVAVNGDYSIFDYHMNGRGPEAEAKRDARIAKVDAGLAALGPNLVPDFDSESGKGCEEFTWRKCECCGAGPGRDTRLHSWDGSDPSNPLRWHPFGSRRRRESRGWPHRSPKGWIAMVGLVKAGPGAVMINTPRGVVIEDLGPILMAWMGDRDVEGKLRNWGAA